MFLPPNHPLDDLLLLLCLVWLDAYIVDGCLLLRQDTNHRAFSNLMTSHIFIVICLYRYLIVTIFMTNRWGISGIQSLQRSLGRSSQRYGRRLKGIRGEGGERGGGFTTQTLKMNSKASGRMLMI